MAGSRLTNTMQEGLMKLLSEIADLKTLPDADLQFLIGLETTVLAKVREPIERMNQAMMQSAGQQPGMAPGGPGAMPGSPAVPGIRQEPAMPNPDEMRRMLQSGAL